MKATKEKAKTVGSLLTDIVLLTHEADRLPEDSEIRLAEMGRILKGVAVYALQAEQVRSEEIEFLHARFQKMEAEIAKLKSSK